MVLFNTNMILRYLLNDNQEMADTAEQLLTRGSVSVTIEVIAETVYVLKGVYSMERDAVAETLKGFLELVRCPDMDILLSALDTYAQHGLDFVDCVLYAYHSIRGIRIVTFDKKLLKLIADA